MNVLLWKKCREARKSPARIIIWVLSAVVLVLLFAYISGPQPSIMVWAYPISICFIASAVFMNVDDVAQAILYRAMGISSRQLWTNNWAFISVLCFLTSGTILLVYAMAASWDPEPILVTNYVLSLPTILMLTSLSTIHYKSNTKKEIAVASVFSVINLAMISLPFFLPLIEMDGAIVMAIAVLSLSIFLVSFVYFHSDRKEDIVRNTERFAMIYDEKFLGDD